MKSRKIVFLFTFIISSIVILYLRSKGIEIPHIELLNLLLFFIFTCLMVYVHELGHVIAGLSTGIKISRVIFGNGRDIFRRRIFGILVIFKNQLGGGYTFVGEIKNGFSKPAFFIFVAGGILMQLAITLPIVLITDFKLSDFIGSYNVSISASFVVANLFMIILTIIPMKVSFRGFSIPNDGMHLLRILFIKQHEINMILSAGKIMEAYELYEARKYYDSQLAFEKCMNDFPDSIIAHFDYSASLLKQAKFEKAEEELIKIKNKNHDIKYDLMIYNNLAWIKLLTFSEESLKEADSFSEKAYKINSKISYIKGTRGSTLIALGRYDEGIRIIKNNVKTNKPVDMETNHIIGFFVLSFAYLKKNDKKSANKYLEIVKGNLNKMDKDDKHLFDILKKESNNFEGYFSTEKEEKNPR